jgi:3-deoxy-D-manno-octulosonic-acid transferase
MLRHGKYRAGLAERFGRVPVRLHDPRPTIWVHAVSVGEVLALSGLIRELQQRMPEHRVVISTTTATGQKLARDRFDENNVFYFPIDFDFAIRPYLRALRPELVIVAETEFWPNFLRLTKIAGARVAIVNARISDRSYPRYRLFRSLLLPVLRNVDLFLAQSEEDRRRLLEIGAPAGRVSVSGNLKFDLKPAEEAQILNAFRAAIQREHIGPVLVCGSTVEDEEEVILRAFTVVLKENPQALLVLAPRHPERFKKVSSVAANSGIPLSRRSQWKASQPLPPGVFLLDSIGELSSFYSLADIAFIGGSLVPKGGHNILEPAQHGAAIVVGPHTENFRDIVALFRSAEAVIITSADRLADAFLNLLADDQRRRDLGARAREILHANSGATARTVAELQSLLDDHPTRAAATAKISPPVNT